MSIDTVKEETLKEYFELIKFPTVAADPMRLRDCVNCAMWLKKWLGEIGFIGRLEYAEGFLGAPPVLFAERPGDEGTPTVLFYGHYDVQPADPIEEWKTDPFEPTLAENGRVYARGAQDDKGQFFSFLVGMKKLILSGARVPTIKVLLEGQEETGSAMLTKLAEDMKESLAADVLLVCDTSAAANLQPAIVAGLRGVAHFTVRLDAASSDLHSGEHGGIAPNPAAGIAQLISSLHNPDGSIAVRGFCDRVSPPSEKERTLAEKAAISPEEYESEFGVPPEGGEKGLTLTERNSFRPTIEVNGIHSGYAGPGSKTVIPSTAFAKISMRLVPDQSPHEVFSLVKEHLVRNTPRGMRLSFESENEGLPGFRLPVNSPVFRLAEAILEELDERGPVFQWDGASIPVVSVLTRISGAAPLLVGFGQSEDRIHAPNESYSLKQFALASQWAEKILSALAE
jgi:acetylornithine deacetylase/succinyl-diaminopimelate desuccinylase-like protein